MLDVRQEGKAVLLKVRVQPRAAKNELAGLCDGALRVRVNAPPVEGAANEACRALLAKVLGVSKSSVEIVSGRSGRNKLVRVAGVDKERVLDLLKNLPPERQLRYGDA